MQKTPLQDDPKEKEIRQKLAFARSFFAEQKTKSLAFRREQLRALEKALLAHEADLLNALKKDLNKSATEAYMTEIALVLEELRFMLKHLPRLARPQKKIPGISQLPASLQVIYEPYGVVLIMSPWNYPIQLTFSPIIAAIAAGNCAIVKPSAYSPHSSSVIKTICQEAFEEGLVQVIEGGREENKALLNLRFDYIFFTGSPNVGHHVMAAAAKHLTPLTLELGGKSPCVVDQTADLQKTAKRILFGKLTNAGQTCVAPDYLYVHKEVKAPLIEALLSGIQKAIPNTGYLEDHFPKIIHPKHFARLTGLLQGQTILIPPQMGLEATAEALSNESTQQIFPVLLDEPRWDSPVMQEEIFGPILPILVWEDEQQLLDQLSSLEKPLALYLFSKNQAFIQKTIQTISSGGVCVNDTLLHMASAKAPFGGVGHSGMGNYHGKAGFYTFSHERTVMKKWWAFDIPMRHHPYSEKDFRILRRLLG